MSYLKDREIWLSNVPTDNPPAGYVWVFIQNGVFVVRDSNGLDKIMATTTGTVTNATSASYVEYSNVASKPALISGSSQVSYTGLSHIPVGIVSGSAQVTYSGLTGIPSGIVSGSAQIVGYNVFATTGSNGFNGSQSITGSLTVTGQVVAQTLNVQQVTSSIVYSSGSNIFGNTLANTQQFTGSVSITGSLNTSIAAFGSAASLYLVSDGGVIKSRTAAQTLSDIAALPLAGGTLTGALNGTSAAFIKSDNSTTAIGSFAANNLSQQTEIWYGGVRMGGTNANVDLNLEPKGTGILAVASAANFSNRLNVTKADATSIIVANYDVNNRMEMSANGLNLVGGNPFYIKQAGGSNQFTITTTGNVGIGTDSPNDLMEIKSSTANQANYRLYNTFNDGAHSFGINWFRNYDSATNSQGAFINYARTGGSSGDLAFGTGTVSSGIIERMRITSGGDVLVNESAVSSQAEKFAVTATNLAAMFKTTGGAANNWAANFWNNATSGNNIFIEFGTETTYTGRGSIDYNRAGGLVRYNTTSDANLKNLIGDSDKQKSVDLLNSTKIREYSWKNDELNKPQIGVIAQELYETYKGAVSVGSDDELLGTEDYKPWSVDKTAFTFHLIAGFQEHERIIKEQQTLIESLKSRIEILEQ